MLNKGGINGLQEFLSNLAQLRNEYFSCKDDKTSGEVQYHQCPPDDATIQWNSREFCFGECKHNCVKFKIMARERFQPVTDISKFLTVILHGVHVY